MMTGPNSRAKLSDTLLGSANLDRTVAFYTRFLGMEVVNVGDGSFVVLKDHATGQSLCVVADPEQKASPGIDSDDLAATLEHLIFLGGRVVREWQFPKMKGATCEDPDGHTLVVWQSQA